MDWLNYHHLLYFWAVAKEGSIVKASETLMLAQPTVSAQIRRLEDSLGEKLFKRSGRSLVLTEVGHMVYGYADEIFGLGRELMQTVKQGASGKRLRLSVGVTDAVPKLVAREILRPAIDMEAHVICREGKAEALLTDLGSHRLDILISDEPAPPNARVKTFNHHLGRSAITFFAAPKLAEKLKRGFPKSLNGAPALLPADTTALRRSLERWFDALRIRPHIVAEFEDSALLKAFAQDGDGFFAVPDVVKSEIAARYGAKPIGKTDKCREDFYAVSAERKLKHPAVVAITEAAREELLG